VALEKLAAQRAAFTADLLDSFPGQSKGDAERLFASAVAAPTRRKAYRSALRGLLQDAPGMIRLADRHALESLTELVRHMPAA
jgi:hypothetical protein